MLNSEPLMLNARICTFLMLVIFACLFFSCKEEVVHELYLPRDSHKAYQHSLDQVGILETALGRDWQNAAQTAIENAMYVETPFTEDFYLDPARAEAVGYRFLPTRGQKIEIQVTYSLNDSSQIFMDVFSLGNGDVQDYPHVASGDEQTLRLLFEPRLERQYILRLQPELLRGGNFRVDIKSVPALAFPVAGRDNKAIGSLFGVPRDGGKRKHHGVDIFAPKHTPIIAPTNGVIRYSGEKGIGGRVIWMTDKEREQTLYFAHLHDIRVQRGDVVSRGDTIGTVGNTGNARTTPAHLHFGIYHNGPIDPYNFIARSERKMSGQLADASMVGKMIRTKKRSKLKVGSIARRAKTIDLDKYQIMESLGASGYYYRVRLPDETTGYVIHYDVELADKYIESLAGLDELTLFSSPVSTAHWINVVTEGEQLNVLGEFSNYQFVENLSGEKGWIEQL